MRVYIMSEQVGNEMTGKRRERKRERENEREQPTLSMFLHIHQPFKKTICRWHSIYHCTFVRREKKRFDPNGHLGRKEEPTVTIERSSMPSPPRTRSFHFPQQKKETISQNVHTILNHTHIITCADIFTYQTAELAYVRILQAS